MIQERNSALRRALSALTLSAALAVPLAAAAAVPGKPPRTARAAPSAMAISSEAALSGFYAVTGDVYVSIDAAGTNSASAELAVEKRSADSTVRAAYLFAASTGFSGFHIADGGITLEGAPVDFDESTEIANSISSFNIAADVTAIVKPVLDAAGVGITTLIVSESSSGSIDGEILAVVFDDPNEPETSINLFYGAQQTTGDSFNILLGEPVQHDEPTQQLSLSLGISFGAQPTGQYSQVDVNSVRLTTAAGGQDDGELSNGALITVGGIGDSTANPENPNATDSDGCSDNTAPFCDDELYDLKAVLADGISNIAVDTLNPSNDDNIYFAALISTGVVAIVNEGILLTPSMQSLPVGDSATITASIQDDDGNPVPDREVSFATDGPNGGSPAMTNTGAGGTAEFTLDCDVDGTTTVVASFLDSNGDPQSSNTATVICEAPDGPMCNGLPATIVGTEYGEMLRGTAGDDVIVGLGGPDTIYGGGGNDTICGGSGFDRIYGNGGDDMLFGGSEGDLLNGGPGEDSCVGGEGYDYPVSCP